MAGKKAGGGTPLEGAVAQLRRIADALERAAVAAGPKAPAGPEGGAKAFSWHPAQGLKPVARPTRIDPALLVGVEEQKSAFFENAGRFIAGGPALDALLWGERGTGKSSLVASLLAKYPAPGWGIVHVREAHVETLPALLDLLAGDERRWFVFLDDLSLSANADAYHELKIFLEGGLSERPSNTLAIATSNRRHLVRERFPDERAIHPDEDVAEETSLSDRFGLSLGFFSMDQETWLAAVEAHLKALGRVAERGEWRLPALQWAMEKGIRSGRSAAQFARFFA